MKLKHLLCQACARFNMWLNNNGSISEHPSISEPSALLETRDQVLSTSSVSDKQLELSLKSTTEDLVKSIMFRVQKIMEKEKHLRQKGWKILYRVLQLFFSVYFAGADCGDELPLVSDGYAGTLGNVKDLDLESVSMDSHACST